MFALTMQLFMFSSIPDAAKEFHTAMTIIKTATAIMAVVFRLLFGWIIKKLLSPDTKAQFIRPEALSRAKELIF